MAKGRRSSPGKNSWSRCKGIVYVHLVTIILIITGIGLMVGGIVDGMNDVKEKGTIDDNSSQDLVIAGVCLAIFGWIAGIFTVATMFGKGCTNWGIGFSIAKLFGF